MVQIIVVFICTSCQNEVNRAKNKITGFKPLTLSTNSFKSGDIILKRSFGMVSSVIIKTLKEKIPITHCGILVKENGKDYVIHSISKEYALKDGVQKINLSVFLEDCYSNALHVVRAKNINGSELAFKANYYNNLNTPFDYKFNHSDSSSMYCSELVYRVIKDVSGKNVFDSVQVNGHSLLTFNSLFDTNHFKVVVKK